MIISRKKLKIPIYSFATLELLLVENISEYCSSIGMVKTNHEPNGRTLFYEPSNGRFAVVMKGDITTSTISHEAFHVTCSILREVGVSLDDSSEEAYAYLLGWIVEEINKFLTKNIDVESK